MKLFAPLALFVLLFSGAPLATASAQPSKTTLPMVKSKSDVVSGVDTISIPMVVAAWQGCLFLR